MEGEINHETTPIDKIVILINKKNAITIKDLAHEANISKEKLLPLLDILSEKGIIKMSYPLVGYTKACTIAEFKKEHKQKQMYLLTVITFIIFIYILIKVIA